MEPYQQALTAIRPETSLGYVTIHVYRPEEVASGQLGYSIDPAGVPLVGEQGGWRANWVVIGHDEMCGDPFFIDVSDPKYPVYTAITGQGHWSPKKIATSIGGFARTLQAISDIAEGREYPVALEKNPLQQADRDYVLKVIGQENP